MNVMVVNTKLYDLLQVSPNANEEDLKKAYRKMSKQLHPDKQGGDETKFKEMKDAYDILRDPNSRSIYDSTGNTQSQGQGAGPGMDSVFSDMFNMFNPFSAHNGPAQSQSKRTQDVLHELSLPLEDFYNGKEKKLKVQRKKVCVECDGKGSPCAEKCNMCKGSGIVVSQIQKGPFLMQQQIHCGSCRGKGHCYSSADTCEKCHGQGTVASTNEITITIVEGTPEGKAYRFPQMADQLPNCTPGDLIIVLKQHKHPIYTRQGDDLQANVSITLRESLLGGKVMLKCLDGSDTTIEFKKGELIRHMDKKIIRGKGMPRGGSYGNLVVTCNVEMPDKTWVDNLSDNDIKRLEKILP
jgi:DnaJ homolog subfamily A member 2